MHMQIDFHLSFNVKQRKIENAFGCWYLCLVRLNLKLLLAVQKLVSIASESTDSSIGVWVQYQEVQKWGPFAFKYQAKGSSIEIVVSIEIAEDMENSKGNKIPLVRSVSHPLTLRFKR